MSKVHIVVGLGFGDEGKGSFVNYLCSKAKNPLVIRFSGGHQVGHTVVVDDKRHVFSNFGSGTLQGAPTYWSEYCTINPVGVLREGNALREAGYKPELILNSEAMVTTPFDILKNIGIDKQNGHGSVGVGFGQTIQRNDDHYHLYARDLRIPKIRDAKLKLIQKTYYDYVVPENSQTELILKNFIRACDDLIERFEIVDDLNDYQHMDWIFEGSQGIMLDMDYGFFPHVTRSNTTSKNAFEILKKYDVNKYVQTYYVTRAYQTRHGNGPMTNDDIDNSHIINNPDETNQSDGFQGVFRKSVLDLDLLVYAIECDRYNNIPDRVHMVITCLDQVPQDIPVTIDGELKKFKYHEIAKNCGITWVHPSYCNTGILNYTYEQDRI